jgi:hypothetical protein
MDSVVAERKIEMRLRPGKGGMERTGKKTHPEDL